MFLKKRKNRDLSREELEDIRLELRALKEDFCGNLSMPYQSNFTLTTDHFIVKFKIKNYGK